MGENESIPHSGEDSHTPTNTNTPRADVDEDETIAYQVIDESEPDTPSYNYNYNYNYDYNYGEAETDSEATAERVLDEIPHSPNPNPNPTNISASDALTSNHVVEIENAGGKTSPAEGPLPGAVESTQEEDVVLGNNQLGYAREERGHLLLAYFAAPSTGKKEALLLQLCDSWSVSVQFDIRRSGWIVFTFESEADSKLILKGSPYFVMGRPVVMKPMPSCFGFDDQVVKYAAVWIQLPGLPLECWSALALSKIASKIGRPLCTDTLTRTKGRVSFPRVLVEVDASKELVRSIRIKLPVGVGKTRVQSVVFEHEHEDEPQFSSAPFVSTNIVGQCQWQG